MPLYPLWLAGWTIVALALALYLVPLAARVATRVGIVDTPGEARRIHRVPTPRAGGVAVYAAFGLCLLGALLTVPAQVAFDDTVVRALLAGGGILLAVGLLDDRFGVRPRVKVLGQVLAAAAAAWQGFVPHMPMSASWVMDVVLFVGWTLVVTNAFNLIDGMDGLAGSVALVALVAVSVYAGILGNVSVLVPCAVLAAAIAGFLRYNMTPAKTFLGDSGSLFVGFALAVLTLAGSERPDGDVSLLMAVCAVPVPLIDTAASIVRRWLRRVPLFSADARHVHHQLAALGYGPRGVVTVVYAISAAIACFGVVLGFAPRETAVAIAIFGGIALGALLIYGCSRLDYHEFNEALSMLLAAPRRARRVIRTQIVVRDLARELRAAASVADLRAVLGSRTAELGLFQMALRPARQVLSMHRLAQDRVWRVLYPLDALDENGDRQFLVVACARGPLAECGTAERIVRMLAPSLDAWFAERRSLALPMLRAELEGTRRTRARAGGERMPFPEAELATSARERDLVASAGAGPLS